MCNRAGAGRVSWAVKHGISICVLVAATAWASPVRAACGIPGPVLSPASGRVVPESPVLYAQAKSFYDLELDITFNGEPVAYEQTAASEYEGGVSYRIEVDARGEGVLEVSNDQYASETLVWRYRVSPDADPPATETYRFGAWSHQDIWMCSRDDAIIVDPGMDADAVLVEWSDTRDSFDHRRGVVLPSPDGTVALGQVSCAWTTIPLDEIESMAVRFTALYSDGSQRPLTIAPMFLERRWLLGYDPDAQVRESIVLPATERPDDESPYWLLIAAIAILLAGIRFSMQRAVLPMRNGQP